MAVSHRLFRPATTTVKNTFSSFLIRSISSSSSSSSGSSLDPKIDLEEAASQLEKSSSTSTSPSPYKGRNFHWVFLGCPGVGKGTYASRLSSLLGVPHIATGDLVREELSSSGLLSSQLKELVNHGKLVPDEFIISLLSKRLQAGKEKGESGYILDGFPRTVTQAEILEGVTNIDLVINLKLREEALLAKCLGRRICSECGANYNVACIDIKGDDDSPRMYMPPLLPPPNCESKLISRADDTEEVVKERLRIYNKMTQPVEEFYKKRRKLLEFELPGGIPESWPRLLRALHLENDKQSAIA
ncbi:adenylate kinase family protein [Arabidopsis lyrata subsp. lyrata]|uniref:adenylate kinase n=1 Tax=Arabidopsis lyrata subsp. lyrata TaxID=81972 RepID=D7LD24_ARALL|nr:probable adenylate kinase 6, chloroplastic [Arabidopsis lyrata subsp. lyrata]EFH56048.1 adenylate kinase family protein [Arabidopsis lyrata subsp. lyrata]|eukprot:XP_002879789.1 probable adenylate kinase 6, chloroplastic [Arabidopsis lyrata subsp. lyrata]